MTAEQNYEAEGLRIVSEFSLVDDKYGVIEFRQSGNTFISPDGDVLTSEEVDQLQDRWDDLIDADLEKTFGGQDEKETV